MFKVAVATDDGMVSPHFGHCKGYTVAVVDGGRLMDVEFVPNPGHEPGLLPRLLAIHGVQRVVAGGIGQRAQMLFAQSGIACITGVQGTVDGVLSALAAGTLAGGASLCDHDDASQGDVVHKCRDTKADPGSAGFADGGR